MLLPVGFQSVEDIKMYLCEWTMYYHVKWPMGITWSDHQVRMYVAPDHWLTSSPLTACQLRVFRPPVHTIAQSEKYYLLCDVPAPQGKIFKVLRAPVFA